MNLRVLIIGMIWPEPTSSAAGWRMLQLIDEVGNTTGDVHFASAATKSPFSYPLANLNVTCHDIVLNDESFNNFVRDLKPDVVIYDRFITEEQFGWRVKLSLPNAVTVLDTEDLHFVRRARTHAFKTNSELNYDTPDCYRELSAIYRCDLSIVISQTEYNLLVDHFKIPKQQLLYLPFIEEEVSDKIKQQLPSFQQRSNYMFIGNFVHQPNYQTVLELKKIWPFIKKFLPKAELHIYGSYPSQKIMQLHNKIDGFIIKGKAEDVNETMQKYRVLLAPIPFGAGLKGKFVDGFKNALPNITSSIGAEGMFTDKWGGFVTDDTEDFVTAACKLYQDEKEWHSAIHNGFAILKNQFSSNMWSGILSDHIIDIHKNIVKHRANLFIQKIMWQNTLQATKYMSLWIEAKNK